MPKKILVIEDEYDIASTVELALEMEGFEVRLCSNGHDGMMILDSEALPDLILSDIMMPIMNGYQFAKTLRLNKRLKHIPLILMSAARLDETMLEKGSTHGFIRKPFDLDYLIDVVTAALL